MRSFAGCLIVAAVASGCPGAAGPSDEAIARYVGDVVGAQSSDGVGTLATEPKRVPARRLAVTIDRAEHVPDVDSGPGDSDVYVLLEVDGQRFKSTIVSSENPSWGDSTVFDARSGAILQVTLLDQEFISSDEKIGTQTLPLPELAVGETTTLTVAFRNGEAGTLWLTATGLARP